MKDKVVIITGASSGIGEALARNYASQNANVVLAARSIEKLETLKKEIATDSNKILIVKTDVSKEEDCKNLIEETIQKFGSIDTLINNAGISMRAIFAETEISVIKQLMDINFWGTVYCTKFALPYLTGIKRFSCWSFFHCWI